MSQLQFQHSHSHSLHVDGFQFPVSYSLDSESLQCLVSLSDSEFLDDLFLESHDSSFSESLEYVQDVFLDLFPQYSVHLVF